MSFVHFLPSCDRSRSVQKGGKELNKSSCHISVFFPRDQIEKENCKKEKKVDEGDFLKVEHGSVLRAVLHPSP